jgi:hypothetical protein
MRIKLLIAVVAGVASVLASMGAAVACPQRHPGASELNAVRAATARYFNLEVAKRHGYALLKDAAGIACIDNPGVGGMGIHYVKGALIDDPAEKARTPELLVYEPLRNGHLRLVAVEYVVLQSAWLAAGHTRAPKLFGHRFELTPAGNRYGLPPFYELHAWIWKHNPRGMFDDWNPRVSCAAA